jgi:pilus assembly protein Flp/PilA
MLFSPKEKGQGLVEYALILVLIAIVVLIVILALIGTQVSTTSQQHRQRTGGSNPS